MVGTLLVSVSFTVSALWIYDLWWFTVVFGVFGGEIYEFSAFLVQYAYCGSRTLLRT